MEAELSTKFHDEQLTITNDGRETWPWTSARLEIMVLNWKKYELNTGTKPENFALASGREVVVEAIDTLQQFFALPPPSCFIDFLKRHLMVGWLKLFQVVSKKFPTFRVGFRSVIIFFVKVVCALESTPPQEHLLHPHIFYNFLYSSRRDLSYIQMIWGCSLGRPICPLSNR